jgi:hypothetical protein
MKFRKGRKGWKGFPVNFPIWLLARGLYEKGFQLFQPFQKFGLADSDSKLRAGLGEYPCMQLTFKTSV